MQVFIHNDGHNNRNIYQQNHTVTQEGEKEESKSVVICFIQT